MMHASPRPSRASSRRLIATVALLATILGGLFAASPVAVASDVPSATVAGPGGPALAADLSQFRPGNIISDAVFFNSGTMSEAQIQSFLQSKAGNCQSGYTCLKDWYDTSRAVEANAMCGAYNGGMRERASTIIYKVALACGINPQAIIVTLQKEQGLVTHTSPSESRYRIAMGQGCPDTAACDTRYYGFFNQVMGAAWQFKRYANPPGTSKYFTWYPVGRVSNIGFNPNAACGSSPVLIENQATAGLYYYTPYQPNGAALRAGYGEGDNCSAYGNRNFYNYFSDWFGSTSAPTIASVSTSTYVLAVSGNTVWGYPFWSGGRWGSAVQVATTAPSTKRVIAVGDLNGDGHRDLVGVDSAGVVSLYPGSSSGPSFGAPVPLGVDWSGAVLIAAAGDFDGDGTPDIFTTDAAGTLWLWRGSEAGALRAPKAVGNGWGGMTALVGAVDMTRDGATDLIARDSAGRLFLYRGDGRGSWLGGTQIGNGWGGMTSILSPGDFSGDGNPDILARDGAGRLWYYYGTGTGLIAGGEQVGVGWGGFSDIGGTGPAATPARVFQAGAGDVDGDGARDVVATDATGSVLLYRGDGRGGWRGAGAVGTQIPPTSRIITLGDFSGDGIADLGVIHADGIFEMLPGTGDGRYGAPIRIGNGWAGFTAVIGGLDFDGDRKLDVIARDAAGALHLYRGNGAGGWIGAPVQVGTGWANMTAIFTVGDFDRDGAPDVMARGADGSLWIYPGNGAGAWRTPRQIGVGWGGFTALFGVGDFDGANGPDVMGRASDGSLILYRNNGSGSWGAVSVIGHGWGGLASIG